MKVNLLSDLVRVPSRYIYIIYKIKLPVKLLNSRHSPNIYNSIYLSIYSYISTISTISNFLSNSPTHITISHINIYNILTYLYLYIYSYIYNYIYHIYTILVPVILLSLCHSPNCFQAKKEHSENEIV